MATLLLIVIYLVFISLGLPDGILGGAWPAINQSLHAPVGLGGVISLVATSMTIISSLATAWLIKKLGVGLLLTVSTALTVTGLVGFSLADNVYWLFILAIPLGLGAGAIDAALNNYVANHYKAHHMNWLHAFWGIGATLGPIIYTFALTNTGDWHRGYLYLGIIQAAIVGLLLLALPLWRKVRENGLHIQDEVHIDPSDIKFVRLLTDRGVQAAFLSFLFYVGVEVALGLWLASYLVAIQQIPVELAALWVGVYYGAITVGRILSGFIVMKTGNEFLIRFGVIAAIVGIVLLLTNLSPVISAIGIVLVGIGFAPVYPGMIHETPHRFGKAKSAKVMSLQMVAGYIGATTIPPMMGLLATVISLNAVVIIALLVIIGLFVSTEVTKRISTRQ